MSLTLEGVRKVFPPDLVVIEKIDLRIETGEFVAILGPSGCGKSTLLKAVGGYMAPTEGEITLKGTRITRPGPDRMMVFQEFDQLLPWKTVRQNVVFALETSRKSWRLHFWAPPQRPFRGSLCRQGRKHSR